MAYQSRVRSDPTPVPRTPPAAPRLILPALRGWYAGWVDPAIPRTHYNLLRSAAKGLALAGWGWRGAAHWTEEMSFEEGSYGFHQQRIDAKMAQRQPDHWAQAEARARATGVSWPVRQDAQDRLIRQTLALLGADLVTPVGWWMGWLPQGHPSAHLMQGLGIRVIQADADATQLTRWAQWWDRHAEQPTAG